MPACWCSISPCTMKHWCTLSHVVPSQPWTGCCTQSAAGDWAAGEAESHLGALDTLSQLAPAAKPPSARIPLRGLHLLLH